MNPTGQRFARMWTHKKPQIEIKIEDKSYQKRAKKKQLQFIMQK